MLGRPFCQLVRKMSSADSAAKPKPSLHAALSPISWLVGKWRGEGCGTYPTINPFTYEEEIEFGHFGQPNLSYNSKSWTVNDHSPMHFESGFLRINPGTSSLAFMLAHNAGITELQEGEVKDKEIHLTSHTMGRMTFAAEPKVLKTERIYSLTDADTLVLKQYMETTTTPSTLHLHITYKKVKEN